MVTSILVHLEALENADLDQFTGIGVHGFWFKRWREDVDEAYGDKLHTPQATPPFTLSPLMGLPRAQRGTVHLKLGTAARFRITSLTDALSDALHGNEEGKRKEKKKWTDELAGKIIQVPQPTETESGIPWKVTRVEVEAQASYEAMSKTHLMNSVPPREWRLEFLTPTTFNSGKTMEEKKDNYLPFPLPTSLIKGWLRRWQAFAPIALPEEELENWTRSNLAVSSYHLQTLPAREGERLRVGCVGSYTLRALDLPPYLRAAIDLLTHYAVYCGSGSHTTQGLGQTRLISSR